MDFIPSEYLLKVREKRPLVHHITNYVTVNDCANVCICAGGSPVMSDGRLDVGEMASAADSLVLNIGTLNEGTVESMLIAGRSAKKSGKPIILDPVGAGATVYRTEVANRLISDLRPEVIKGNKGEISVLIGCGGTVRGVDSISSCRNLTERMAAFAREHGCIIVATGETDYVTDGETVLELSNGVDMLENVSGTGCSVSTVIGVYIGACGPSVWSVSAAISAFNIAAEDAAEHCLGPGSFKTAIMDSLYALRADGLDDKIRFKAF